MTRKLTYVASRLAKPRKARDILYIVDFENVPWLDVAALLRRKRVLKVVLAANRTNTVTPETMATIEKNPERVEVIIGRVTRKEFVDKLVIAKVGEYAFRYPDAEIVVIANDRDYTDLAQHLNDHWEREVPIQHEVPRGRPSRRGVTGRRRPARKRASTEGATAASSTPARQATAKQTASKAASQATKKTATKKTATKKTVTKKKTATKKTATKKTVTKKAAVAGDREVGDVALTNPDAEAVFTLLAKLPRNRRPKSRDALLNAIRNYRESVGLRSRPTTILNALQDAGLLDARKSPVTYSLP